MLACINKNSVEYQSLKSKANIPEVMLEARCRSFLDKYDRFPNLDELPGSNSENHLKELLHVNNESAKISDILENTGKETVQEAVIEINNSYRDLETEITPVVNEAFVDINHRPVTTNFKSTSLEQDKNIDNSQVFEQVIDKLFNLYGIKINSVNSQELNSEKWKGLINDAQLVNAFIYNGEIYINTDIASVDAPLHELMHLLIGELRFNNPKLYQELVNSVQNWSNYKVLSLSYSGRSRNDINEELFVTEVSKYLLGQPCNLLNLDNKSRYEIQYNIKRLLDSILMGQNSVKTISDSRLYKMSLKELAEELNSTIMKNSFTGTFNVKNSELHRRLNNTKSELIKNKQLQEVCD